MLILEVKTGLNSGVQTYLGQATKKYRLVSLWLALGYKNNTFQVVFKWTHL